MTGRALDATPNRDAPDVSRVSAPPDVVIIPGTGSADLLQMTMRELIAGSRDVAFAIERVRLPALHMVADILPTLERCRMTLARLDAHSLDAGGRGDAEHRHSLERLLEFARSGRLEIRSAGAIRWEPDFSLFHMNDPACGTFCLFGAHYLAPPHAGIDWPLTCVISRRSAVRRAVQHYESLWAAAHDALGAVTDTLERQLCA